MSERTIPRAWWRDPVAFGVGAVSLEVTGSVLHAYVVRDVAIPLEKMLPWDLVIGAIAGAALLGWQGLVGRSSLERLWLAWGLGVAFALLLELLNDVLPGALFTPTGAVGCLVAWGYVALATLGVAFALARRR